MSENYTKEMEAILRGAEPVTYDEAVEFGVQFGKSTRSVISKVQSLGLEYVKKPTPAKRPKGLTKADLVQNIALKLSVEQEVLDGLDKATGNALRALFDAVS